MTINLVFIVKINGFGMRHFSESWGANIGAFFLGHSVFLYSKLHMIVIKRLKNF